jgi:hypothetical protein
VAAALERQEHLEDWELVLVAAGRGVDARAIVVAEHEFHFGP